MKLRMTAQYVRMIALVVAVGALFVGCVNDPASGAKTFPSSMIFDALRLVDMRGDEPVIVDTVAVYFAGTNSVYAYNVQVNNSQLGLRASSAGQSIYTGSAEMIPGGALTVDVKTSRNFVSNTMQLPEAQPVINAPVNDTVFASGAPVTIEWSGPTSGTVWVEVSDEKPNGAISDSLWIVELDAALGSVVVPDSVWARHTEDAVALMVWSTKYHEGEGFDYGCSMTARLGARLRFKVSAP